MLTSLVEKLDELDERIIQDQRMVKATEKWTACMLEKGYRYEEPDEIDSDLEERFKAIVGTGVAPGTTTPPPGASFDRAALTELQREEVRIANADLDCEKQEIEPVELEVRPQYEAGVPQAEPAAAGAREARRPRTSEEIDENAGWSRLRPRWPRSRCRLRSARAAARRS